MKAFGPSSPGIGDAVVVDHVKYRVRSLQAPEHWHGRLAVIAKAGPSWRRVAIAGSVNVELMAWDHVAQVWRAPAFATAGVPA